MPKAVLLVYYFFMGKKKYVKPLLRLISSEAQAAQCVSGWAPSLTPGSCTSGPAANLLCNAGNWADTQCYAGFNAIGPAEPTCSTGNAAGTSCNSGTSAGSQAPPATATCTVGFSPTTV
ncbi:MAG: hypothetical protein JW774_01220 [Candidatus Aureabacteria bacterium]|nr:hypothetical protein [Candidatus Auribacterota bacterium]